MNVPSSFETARGMASVRLAELSDIPALIALNRKCFPTMAEEPIVWHGAQLTNHIRLFPEGQMVVEMDGKPVGAVSSLIVQLGVDPYRAHTYSGITDGGYFHNHDPQGDTLYGADVYVDPEYRNLRLGHYLYEARRHLCRRLNLRRITAGGRIQGYHLYEDRFTPEQYVAAVENGQVRDLVLSFQLREGFIVRSILRNYVRDPLSRNCATFIEWLNPDYRPPDDKGGKVRVAAVQHQVRKVDSFAQFADQIEYFVSTATEYRADFVVFPEFVTVQLLSQESLKNLPSVEGIARLAQMTDAVLELFSRLAKDYGICIIGGSHPMRNGNKLENVCPIVFPDGRIIKQPKLHITPSEKQFWGIDGGNSLQVIHTPRAKIGVLICYEASRYLADQGAEIIFVPYCTDDRQGYSRVRYCCQARAIENQVYVVTTGVIGNLPSVAAMDIHYGRAAVFTPSDFEFARDGIQAEADSNVEMLLVTDLDVNDLYRSRASGSVRPRLDRRRDLFEYRTTLTPPPSQLVEHSGKFDPIDDAGV
jgi:predicted amidohydrolase/GNAT superfamily N-acetyltransferase